MYTKRLSIENADDEQSNLLRFLSNSKKGRKHQKNFLKNVEMLLKARKDALNSFKSNLFPINSNTTSRETSVNE